MHELAVGVKQWTNDTCTIELMAPARSLARTVKPHALSLMACQCSPVSNCTINSPLDSNLYFLCGMTQTDFKLLCVPQVGSSLLALGTLLEVVGAPGTGSSGGGAQVG